MIGFLIDPAVPGGKFRKIHGMNLAAPITSERRRRTVSEFLRRLNVPQTRMHDCPLNNPGKLLVDMQCIFPLVHADPARPENYLFADTDDYFANTLNYGTTIMYRLGTSIDHSGYAHNTAPPEDPDKWIEIASHIIAHYNEGWADGFHYGIEYWEIWNEADTELPILWSGTWAQFIKFYCRVAGELKRRWPQLKIGGPSMSKWNIRSGAAVREFLAGCRERHAPLDFFSYHQYSDKPQKMQESPAEIRRLLDEYGYPHTEIHLTEWHYHCGWGSQCGLEREKYLHREMVGSDSAAFLTAVLSRFQDGPVDMTHYYTGSTGGGYSLFDSYCEPQCGYHAFEFFNRLTDLERIKAQPTHPDTTVLAGKTTAGRLKILAACFKTDQDELSFVCPGVSLSGKNWKLNVIDIDGVKRELTDEIRLEDNRLIFEKASGSMTVFLEIGGE